MGIITRAEYQGSGPIIKTTTTVSYTHLDVYKRQAYAREKAAQEAGLKLQNEASLIQKNANDLSDTTAHILQITQNNRCLLYTSILWAMI